jgi:signal peptidase I
MTSPGNPDSPTSPPLEKRIEGPIEHSAEGSAVDRKKWLIENVVSLTLALLVVFTIRSSLIEAFKIPSGSMIPTLLIGDHIFVNKLAYGFKLPFSDWITGKPTYLIEREPPKRGDIIVFLYPGDTSLYYIKRVVGVPGDTIEMRNKQLYVNGNAVQREPIGEEASKQIFSQLEDPRYSTGSIDVFRERFEQDEHVIMVERYNNMDESRPPITVPPQKLFVMGDNRDFSNDSRYWGFVPYENVKGKALFVWLSLWLNLGDGQVTFRPGRIGTVLHHAAALPTSPASAQP